MAKLFLCLMLGLLTTLLVACQSTGATPNGDAEPTMMVGEEPAAISEATAPSIPEDLSDLVITKERTGCRGFCPIYTVTIDGDGTVQYIGEAFVEVEGEQTAQISESDLRTLVQAFNDADFFNMQDRYETDVTDLPSTTTSITLNGETKSVYNYSGAPESLLQLEQIIDDISGADEWVGEVIP